MLTPNDALKNLKTIPVTANWTNIIMRHQNSLTPWKTCTVCFRTTLNVLHKIAVKGWVILCF